MRVNSFDFAPPSMLTRQVWYPGMVAGGILSTAFALVGLPLLTAMIFQILEEAGFLDHEPEEFVEQHVISAEIVRLGEKRDPDRLPSRIVPRKSTAPDNSTVVSKEMEPEKPKKPKEKPPERAELDDLLRVGDRAQDFAEIAKHEMEGDPDGDRDGTATESDAKNSYINRLASFIRRGWTVPSTLNDTSHLQASVEVEITRDLKVGPFELISSSGEALFDQSLEDRLNELRSLQTTLPEPPPELEHIVLGQRLRLNFKGTGL